MGRPGKQHRLQRLHAYWTRRTERKAARKQRADEGSSRWFDHGFDKIDFDLDGMIAVAIIITVVALLIFGAPILYLLALDLLEILLLPVLAAMVVVWRTLRGSGFTLTAARDGKEVQRWHADGVGTARAMERSIAEAVAAGGDVTTLFVPENVDRVDEESSRENP